MRFIPHKFVCGLAIAFCASALQAAPLSIIQNTTLSVPAAIIAAPGAPGSTNLVGSNFLMSAVGPASSQGGYAWLRNSQQWAQRYPAGFQSQSGASGMVVRPDGSIVATGFSFSNFATRDDFLTIAYSSDGKPLWTNLYDGPAHLDDGASYITTGPGGDVWVAGSSSRTVTNFGTPEIILIKYSNNGLPLWTNIYSSAETNSDYPEAMVTDNTGNTYLLLSSVYWFTNGTGTTLGDTLIKYDPSGIALWTNQNPSDAYGFRDIVTPLVDAAGNLFIAGDFGSEHYFSGSALVKLNSAGVPVWTNLAPMSPFRGVVADNQGNFILTGETISPSYVITYVMTKVSADGISLWTNTMTGPLYDGGNVPQAAVDPAGNVFLIGGRAGAADSGLYQILKVSADGIPLWTNLTVNLLTNDSQLSVAAVDNGGNLYLAGNARYTSPSNTDFVTVKFSADGFALWTNRFDGSGLNDYLAAMTVDGAGNLYVAGQSSISNWFGFGGASSSQNLTVVKYADVMFYQPPKDFTGTDTITYTVTDKLGNQGSANLPVAIIPGEFQLGISSPTNLTPAGLDFTLNTTLGTNLVVIETSADLMNWVPILTNFAVNGSIDFTDPPAANLPKRFYRAVSQAFNTGP